MAWKQLSLVAVVEVVIKLIDEPEENMVVDAGECFDILFNPFHSPASRIFRTGQFVQHEPCAVQCGDDANGQS